MKYNLQIDISVRYFKFSLILSEASAPISRQRPYHIEYTSSRPITEIKQCWARLVLGWVTAWEHWVLLALFTFVPIVPLSLLGRECQKMNYDLTSEIFILVLSFLLAQ